MLQWVLRYFCSFTLLHARGLNVRALFSAEFVAVCNFTTDATSRQACGNILGQEMSFFYRYNRVYGAPGLATYQSTNLTQCVHNCIGESNCVSGSYKDGSCTLHAIMGTSTMLSKGWIFQAQCCSNVFFIFLFKPEWMNKIVKEWEWGRQTDRWYRQRQKLSGTNRQTDKQIDRDAKIGGRKQKRIT